MKLRALLALMYLLLAVFPMGLGRWPCFFMMFYTGYLLPLGHGRMRRFWDGLQWQTRNGEKWASETPGLYSTPTTVLAAADGGVSRQAKDVSRGSARAVPSHRGTASSGGGRA